MKPLICLGEIKMINMMIISLGIAIVFWITSIICACLGHVDIALGAETWRNKKYENIYYYFLAPIGIISLGICVIFCLIYAFTH